MAEYIERKVAKWHLYREFITNKEAAAKAFRALSAIPAADVRPVVLCRDCKCYRQSNFVDKHMECARSGFPVHSVDFCSFGERMEES